MPDRQPRKGTLSELMGLDSRGIRCPSCGASGEWSVYETQKLVHVIRRRRFCRVCKKVSWTEERILGPAIYQPPVMGESRNEKSG